MTVSYLEDIDVAIHKNEDTVDKRRSKSLMIFRWESSPAGIDWEMIRSVRKNAQLNKAKT